MADGKFKSESYALLGGMNVKSSPYNDGPTELRSIVNLNFVTPGALTQRPGTTLYVGATIAGRITGGVEFERLSGASYLVVTANTNAYSVTSGFNAFKTGLTSGALFDFVTFVDRLFAANGAEFFKYDGTNTTNYSLPQPPVGWGPTLVAGGSLIGGTYLVSYGYINDRGYVGPGASSILFGTTVGFCIQFAGLTTPSGFGISALLFYRTSNAGVDLFGTTTSVAGSSLFSDTGFPLTTQLLNDNLYFTLVPKYFEIYNNQLFMAGFSSLLSTAYWSQIGEPEGVDPDFSAEFRTNDGDRISGMKSYAGSLVVTKERSFHRITGDNPSNLALQEISDQYGCLSNRAMVVFEDTLWFLDSKGIVEYNGANVRVVSTDKMEPIFTSMNVSAARENAVAIHYRQFNEIWFAIPCDGATFNNRVVVFDYHAKAWTTYEGVNASSLFLAKGSLDQKTVCYGGYTGNLFNFGASLFGDAGAQITCMIKTGWHSGPGHTSETIFRRFYLDVDPILGVTLPINVNLRTNFGSTVQATRTMYQNPYQSRVEFGLSAKSVQAEVVRSSATLPIKINGFTFESRKLRDV